MKLTKHQNKIYYDIIEGITSSLDMGQKFFGSLTGPAGTGKTLMTSKLIDYLLNKYPYKKLRITTPTHKSLKVINDYIDKNIKNHKNFSSSTIHAYLNLKLQTLEDKIILIEDYNDGKFDGTKILIIDESSMVSKNLFEHIKNKAIKSGIDIVLFVGDKLQLPPVDGGYNPVYEEINQYELTEVVRQAQNNPILKKATEIRYCIAEKKYDKNVISFDEFKTQNNTSGIFVFTDIKEWLKHYLENKSEDKVISAYTNNSVNMYNNFIRKNHFNNSKLPKFIEGEEIVLQDAYEIDGKFINNGEILTVYSPTLDYNRKLQMSYWTFTSNEKDIWVNVLDDSSIGNYNLLLNKISEKAKQMKFENKHNEAIEMWGKYWKIKKMFVDVKYNYAHTIHKLQGSTYNDVYLNLNETFSNCKEDDVLFRLLYVALTRARNNVYILI